MAEPLPWDFRTIRGNFVIQLHIDAPLGVVDATFEIIHSTLDVWVSLVSGTGKLLGRYKILYKPLGVAEALRHSVVTLQLRLAGSGAYLPVFAKVKR